MIIQVGTIKTCNLHHIWSRNIPTIISASSWHDLPWGDRLSVCVMTSQWQTSREKLWTLKYKQGAPTSNTREKGFSNEHISPSVTSTISSLCTFTILSEVCILNLQCEIWQLNRENSHQDCGAIFSTFTHGLCAYNAQLLNNDVRAIKPSYRWRREFPKLRTSDHCRMCHNSWQNSQLQT